MDYVIELLNKQIEMLSDKYLAAEGVEELLDIKERLDEYIAVVELLNLDFVTQQSEPLINSEFLKYIASNRPLLLFELTNEVETYQELINGG
jgi:hypothetical protein